MENSKRAPGFIMRKGGIVWQCLDTACRSRHPERRQNTLRYKAAPRFAADLFDHLPSRDEHQVLVAELRAKARNGLQMARTLKDLIGCKIRFVPQQVAAEGI